jgi:hypothetical protein
MIMVQKWSEGAGGVDTKEKYRPATLSIIPVIFSVCQLSEFAIWSPRGFRA